MGSREAPVPHLECIQHGVTESFRYREHGFSFEKTRWNYHPEFELQLIVATTGTAAVGDSIRDFAPGYLALIGPNLPHDFLSDIGIGDWVEERSRVIQFGAEVVAPMLKFPEFRQVEIMLDSSDRGIEFGKATASAAALLIDDIGKADAGPGRLILLFRLLTLLAESTDFQFLASRDYRPTIDQAANDRINQAMNYIRQNLSGEVRLRIAAELVEMNEATFSRFFKRHTGRQFVDYVRNLRVGEACKLLRDSDFPITDICFQVGFNNLSNFNRTFLRDRGMTPSHYRRRALSSLSHNPIEHSAMT